MEYVVELEDLPRQQYVAVRQTVRMSEIGQAIGPGFARLFGWLGEHGVSATGMPWTRYLVMGRDECEIEVGAPVAVDVRGDAGIVPGVLPAMTVARTLHIGPYEKLGEAFTAVTSWMAANEYATAGAMWECYYTSPDEEPDPERWRTGVYVPVFRAAAA